MARFTIKAHVEPDMEGPGLPGEPDMDDKMMGKKPVVTKASQFALPKSPKPPAGKKPPSKGNPPPQKVKM